jgi:chromosome condensin MukBEF ATPase and DNA-binding subunit MukB
MSDDIDDAKLAAFVSDATKFSSMFASFATVGAELKKVVSLRNAEREAEQRVAVLRRQQEEIGAACGLRKGDADRAVAQALFARDQALVTAGKTKRDAEVWAEALRSQHDRIAVDARRQADDLIAKARGEAAKTLDEAKYKAAAEEARVSTAKAELETLSAQLADRQKHLDVLATHASEFARKVGR